ncbi:MAG: prenyltransferase [Kofleriaceae bacterium]
MAPGHPRHQPDRHRDPCLAALLLGLVGGAVARPLLAITAALGALVLQVGVNLMNDVEDHRRLIDGPGGLGGAGVIQRGWLSARVVRRAALGCFVVGGALGLPAIVAEPGPLLGVATVALVGAVGYSGRGLALKYRALGDLAVITLCGPVLTVGFALAAFGTLAWATVLLGVAFGLMAVGILHTNNLQDIDDDRACGAVTVASLLGVAAGKRYLVALYLGAAAAWIGAAVAAELPWFAALVPLATLLPLAPLVRDVLAADDLKAPTLALIRIRAAQAHLAFGVTACVALGVALATH